MNTDVVLDQTDNFDSWTDYFDEQDYWYYYSEVCTYTNCAEEKYHYETMRDAYRESIRNPRLPAHPALSLSTTASAAVSIAHPVDKEWKLHFTSGCVFSFFLSEEESQAIVGDLEERFEAICTVDGWRRASFWYWTQMIRSLGSIVRAWIEERIF